MLCGFSKRMENDKHVNNALNRFSMFVECIACSRTNLFAQLKVFHCTFWETATIFQLAKSNKKIQFSFFVSRQSFSHRWQNGRMKTVSRLPPGFVWTLSIPSILKGRSLTYTGEYLLEVCFDLSNKILKTE